MSVVFGVVLALWPLVSAMYGPGDDVVVLDASNFHQKVVQGDELWLVEFYAPWCGHCQALTPEWKQAASALKGIAKVGAVDADQHKNLGGQFEVRGFPTIKIFGANKYKPSDYNGPRTAQGLIDAAMSNIRTMANERKSGSESGGSSSSSGSGGGSGGSCGGGGGGGGSCGGGSGGSCGGGGGGGGSCGGGGGSGGGGSGGSGQNTGEDVVQLTDSNFDEKVLKSDDLWLVEFFAPWCGHCKNLAPEWAKAATDLKGKIKLGAVDATVETVVSNKYGVRGFPTIKMFPSGQKDGESVEYDGGRSAADIVSWALDKLAENVPPPEIIELTEEKVLSDACEGRQLCVISILPHILDCQSECRNNYLKTLTILGDKYKKKTWGWVWAEAGTQPEVEEALGIGGFGYPAMAAVNSRKMKYAILRGAFSDTGINEFLRALALGRGSTAPVKNAKLPEVKNSDPWDGQDGVMPEEEDIDLSDVVLDDLDEDTEKNEL